MTLLALGLVFGSAFAHVGWNYLTKASDDKVVFTWCFTSLASLLYFPLAAYFVWQSPIPPEGWLLIAGTMLLHVGYFNFLTLAYTHGDLSLVYPIARGAGIALIPLIGHFLLGEAISLPAALAIGLILAGIFVVHARGPADSRPGLKTLLSDKGTRFALVTGLFIAAYSTWDKRGVSLVPPPALNYAIFLTQALAATPVVLRRPAAITRELAKHAGAVLLAAVLAPLAYLLVLIALTFSRVSYVAPSREIGIVIGVLLGRFVLEEAAGWNRLLGAAAIVLGVIGLALAP